MSSKNLVSPAAPGTSAPSRSVETVTRIDAHGRTEREEATGADVAITIKGVDKVYQIYKRPEDRLKQIFFRSATRFFESHRALHAVTLDIKRGESVGLVGLNGSGKSTLLQIIAGLLPPSAGTVEVRGRLSALLELGAGFNPSFSGRENVYLNAAVLGLSRDEIDSRFDRIVDFSGLRDAIDRPVDTYSSGMYVRLAFSVAISVDPDVLIVDEALAVGDESFQRKCFARIEELRRKGTTILFVSHTASTVTQFCDRAVLLDMGEVLAVGEPKLIISNYQRLSHAAGPIRERIREEIRNTVMQSAPKLDGFAENLKSDSRVAYVERGARIEDPEIKSLDGQPVNQLLRGRRYVYSYRVRFLEKARAVVFGMMIKSTSGVELGGRASGTPMGALPDFEAGETVVVTFEFNCLLASGTYFLNAGLSGLTGNDERHALHRLVDAAMFQVLPDTENTVSGFVDFQIVTGMEMDTPGQGEPSV